MSVSFIYFNKDKEKILLVKELLFIYELWLPPKFNISSLISSVIFFSSVKHLFAKQVKTSALFWPLVVNNGTAKQKNSNVYIPNDSS